MEIKIDNANLSLHVFQIGPFGTNSYFLVNKKGEVVVIDTATDAKQTIEICESNSWVIKAILATHGHWDHIYANMELCEHFGCDLYIGSGEARMLEPSYLEESSHGLPIKYKAADVLVEDGELHSICGMQFEVIFTPGHTAGGVCYRVDNLLFAGDTLFERSIGRTDLDGGDFEMIIRSIKEKLFILPDDVKVFPGHGGATTIGTERVANPYCR